MGIIFEFIGLAAGYSAEKWQQLPLFADFVRCRLSEDMS